MSLPVVRPAIAPFFPYRSVALVVAVAGLFATWPLEHGRSAIRVVDVGATLFAEGAFGMASCSDPLAHARLVAPVESAAFGFAQEPRHDDEGRPLAPRTVLGSSLSLARVDGERRLTIPLPAKLSSNETQLAFVVDGDLYVGHDGALAIDLVGAAGRHVHLVVEGDVEIGDDLSVDDGKLTLWAVGARVDDGTFSGGHVVLGDRKYGSLTTVDADIIASGTVDVLDARDAPIVTGRVLARLPLARATD